MPTGSDPWSAEGRAGGHVETHAERSAEPLAELLPRLQAGPVRLLIGGAPGLDRQQPFNRLAALLAQAGTPCLGLSADPALPAFHAPGALALGRWEDHRWVTLDAEPLCSLDALRFRLPLVAAASRLLQRTAAERLLLLAPGLGRSAAGEELLDALLCCCRIDAALWLCAGSEPQPPPAALSAALPAGAIHTAAGCARDDALARAARRGQLWREHMAAAASQTVPLSALQLLGAPPQAQDTADWRGRMVALLCAGRLQALGEVIGLHCGLLQMKLAHSADRPQQLLIRDAIVTDGTPHSAPRRQPATPPPAPEATPASERGALPPASPDPCRGPAPSARVGQATAHLLNGVLGDPLLQLQLVHERRSLLFDLGDPGRLSARAAHQVSDVFISHTHADHIGGFMWLLRSRIGRLPPCRFHGPPGLARQLAGMVGGILWDRAGDRAPRFEIREWHGQRLHCYHLTAGRGAPDRQDDIPVRDGVVWREAGFLVRAARLDHHTPVMAYAWEPVLQVRVRRERLAALGMATGHWLQALKRAVVAGRLDEIIAAGDGRTYRAGALCDELLIVSAGDKLVYATDFGDTADNRRQLTALAAGAHTLFCEASFMLEHAEQAARTWHLTTRACGEIATAAGVRHLHPFHFSRRYVRRLPEAYREIQACCDRTVLPPFMTQTGDAAD